MYLLEVVDQATKAVHSYAASAKKNVAPLVATVLNQVRRSPGVADLVQ